VKMKLFLISQDEDCGYDTYDSAVVAAETPEEASKMHPSGDNKRFGKTWSAWCNKPESVTVEYLGEADISIKEPTVICASFNAG